MQEKFGINYNVRRKAPCFSYGDISRQFLLSNVSNMTMRFELSTPIKNQEAEVLVEE